MDSNSMTGDLKDTEVIIGIANEGTFGWFNSNLLTEFSQVVNFDLILIAMVDDPFQVPSLVEN